MQGEIMAAKLLGASHILVLPSPPAKGKEKIKTKKKETYLLDISKANQIFDFLVKDK